MVTSYEDLIAKCVEREAKEQDIEKGKRKRGRNRTSPGEAEIPEPDSTVTRIHEAQVVEDVGIYRAPVTQM